MLADVINEVIHQSAHLASLAKQAPVIRSLERYYRLKRESAKGLRSNEGVIP